MAIQYNPKPLPPVQTIPFSVSSWQGLNRIKGSESQGEMVSMRNMSSDSIPFSSPRPSREVIATALVNPQNLFNAGGKLGYITDGNLYYDKDGFISIDTVGNTSAIVDFNGNVVMYPSNFYYDYIENVLDEISESTTLTKATGSYLGSTGATATAETQFYQADGTYGNTYRIATIKFSEEITVSAGEIIRIDSNAILPTDTKHTTKVYVVAYNASSEIISYDVANKFYKIFEIGAPIQIANATKLKVMIGYSKLVAGSWVYDTTLRNTEYARADISAWVTRSTYPTAGGIPVIEYATQLNNRIFAVEGNNIYSSAQGNFADWTTFADVDGNPDPTGAFATDVGSVGRFNGIVAYKNRIVCTKPDFVYEIYGDRPPYTVQEIAKTGCIDGRSICEVNSVLYWLGRQGIYAYTGGQPRIISDKLNIDFTEGVAGTDGRKYYCSLYSDKWQLYVYDTFTNLWHIEDDLHVMDFTYFEGKLYALTSDGSILKFDSGTERVEWEFETQDYTFDIPNSKSVRRLFIRAEMQPYTELDVYLRANNEEYIRVANYSARDMTLFDFKVRVKKCDSFSLKFVGRGNVKILDIHGEVTVGTAKHRSGDNLKVYR